MNGKFAIGSFPDFRSWHEAAVRGDSLIRLLSVTKQTKVCSPPRLREAYAPTAPYDFALEICENDFDPAKADKGCW
jgi:hypothetical protein